jgi:hypothetical protein
MQKANFFVGTKVISAIPPIVNLNMEDRDLFEVVLHDMSIQWSSTGGRPHHKVVMKKGGNIVRTEGKVHIAGCGWNVTYTTAEYDKKQADLIAKKDWEGLASFMCEGMRQTTI